MKFAFIVSLSPLKHYYNHISWITSGRRVFGGNGERRTVYCKQSLVFYTFILAFLQQSDAEIKTWLAVAFPFSFARQTRNPPPEKQKNNWKWSEWWCCPRIYTIIYVGGIYIRHRRAIKNTYLRWRRRRTWNEAVSWICYLNLENFCSMNEWRRGGSWRSLLWSRISVLLEQHPPPRHSLPQVSKATQRAAK